MNEAEHLVACLMEEAAEIGAETSDIVKCCGKILRFGGDDKITHIPEGMTAAEVVRGMVGPTNIERLLAEVNDMLGVMRLMEARGIIPPNWEDPGAQKKKGEKITRYMSYSRMVGALDAPAVA